MPVGGCCCAEGMAGLIDRFAPNWIVGNVPAGDSAVAYSVQGFHYIPDPGDGSGIAAALAAAGAAGGGVVTYRFGIYDLNGAGSPVAMTVPKNVILVGPGPLYDDQGVLVGPIVARSTGDATVFNTNNLGPVAIRDTGIVFAPTNNTSTGSWLVGGSVAGSQLALDNVEILASFDPAQAGAPVLTAINSAGGTITNCKITNTGAGGASSPTWTTAIRAEGDCDVANVHIDGTDVGVMIDGDATVSGSAITAIQRAVLGGQGASSRVSTSVLKTTDADGICVETDADALVTANFMGTTVAGLTAAPAVLLHGSHAVVSSNQIEWARAGAAVELGTAGGAETVSHCAVEGNIIVNDADAAGVGILVSNANCTSNTLGGGSIEVQARANAFVDLGTTTEVYEPLATGAYIPSPLAALNADSDALTQVRHPIVKWAPSATRKYDPRTAPFSMAQTMIKTNALAFGIVIDVTTGGATGWTTPAGVDTDYTLLNSAAPSQGSWLIEIDVPNLTVTVTPVV